MDKVDIKHASFADPSNHVRTLEAGSGQKAILTFSEKTSEVSAFLVSNNGVSKAIANENLPKDFQMIKSLDSFNGFLENAQARGTVLSDGEAKLYVMQKGVGGADPKKQNPENVGKANMDLPAGFQLAGTAQPLPTGINLGTGIAYSAPIGDSGSGVVGINREQHIGTGSGSHTKPSYSVTGGFRFRF